MKNHNIIPLTRREMLKSVSSGFGYLALAGLCAEEMQGAEAARKSPLAPKVPHFAARAKRVIFLCMRGGPSHVDTFDHKPKLTTDNGQPGRSRNRSRNNVKLLGSPWEFKRHGQNGLWISELFPHVAKHADQLCLLNGMHTDLPAHAQAFVKMHTGNSQFVRPSLGAWTLYGLGTENENLPGFITLAPQVGFGGAQNYGSSFLPAIYQAASIGRDGQVSNIANRRLTRERQRIQLDLVQGLNAERLKADEVNPAVEGVIESFELAFRMQSEVPALMDLSKEPAALRESYGIGNRATDNFGRQCLLARRLAEAGVRFIELNAGNWDHHRNLRTTLERSCASTDQPIAALLADLAARDMLKDTLVMWGGEFGRTPHAQNADGRDHNNKGYTMWMAGGGVQGGLAHGATDDYGYEAVDGKMHIHDWHATILHLLGLNHKKLTFNYAGRDFRLTDVHGNVAKEILA